MSQELEEKTPPYDFGTDPISVNIYLPNAPKPNKFRHRLHKPTPEQWMLWGHEIYDERRQLSPEEIEEENRLRGDDEPIESAYETHFNEYDASRRLYEAIAIDVTEYKLDEEGEMQPAKSYPLTPELLEKAVLNKDVVISGLYKSYCALEDESDETSKGEVRVRQAIGFSDSPPSVVHVLREATEDERQQFRDEGLRWYGVADKPETRRTCLNLRVADDLYNAMLLRIEDATLNGQAFDESIRAAFVKAVSPVFKFKVLEEALRIKLMYLDYDRR